MTEQEIQEQAEKFLAQYGDIPDIAKISFIQGAKWMQEQDKWISVDVKPDKEFADILLYFGGEDCSCSGYYVKNANVFMAHSVMCRCLTVTHWKPFTLTT